MNVLPRRPLRRIAAACALIAVLAGASACKDARSPLNPSDYGIESTDLVVGNGTEVRVGRGATVYYTLWLVDETRPDRKGTLVESNVGGQPFSFIVGIGQVIAGWDIGVQGMRDGGKRRLVIPPDYAYGAQVREKIPANSTLLFEIEVVGVY